MKLGIRQIGSWSGISFLNNPTRPSTLHAILHLDWWSKIHVGENARLVADVVLVPSVALVQTKCLASFGLICNRKVLKGDLGFRRIQTDANVGLVRKPGYCTARSLHLRKKFSQSLSFELLWLSDHDLLKLGVNAGVKGASALRSVSSDTGALAGQKTHHLMRNQRFYHLEQTSWLTAIFT